ncbi:hypothetical protein GGR57DRAFT_492795 [Xylariaceae sp. FL1272]|nr:hypothetical protein GGR57DRAFT_492795 [Xylariaceae sp. FL1272]
MLQPRSCERYQLAMYMLNQYRGTSVSCRYLIPSTLRSPDQEQKLVSFVEAALCDNVLKHSVLYVGIADADSSHPAFVQLDSLDLRQHIEWRYLDDLVDFETTLKELTESQIDASYPHLEKQPGWRVVVLHQRGADFLEIMFTWNHPHADGTAGKHPDLDGNTLKLPCCLPKLPPPIEQIMPLPLGVSYFIKALIDDTKPPVLCRSPTLAHWAPITASPYRTHFQSFTTDPRVLSKVLTVCRNHQTTLTSLFHGLVLTSLATHLDKGAASGFESATTIDQRRFVPSAPEGYPSLEPKNTMGNFVTLMYHTFEPVLVAKIRSAAANSPKATGAVLTTELTALIWATAIRVRNEVSHKLELGVKNDLTGTMKYVSDWRTQMAKAARKPRHASWLITGLGVIDDHAPPENSWRICRAQFALSTEVPGAALMISPMTVSGERLCVGGSWQSGVVDEALGSCVMADLERWLGIIGTSEQP